MGYESRVYIVQEHKPWSGEKLGWGSVLAMFNLCKMGYKLYYKKTFHDLFNQERTCFMYDTDGNTKITEDFYGDPVQKADNKEVIKWLRKFCKENEYWRAKALLSCLESLEKTGESYSIYHFGY